VSIVTFLVVAAIVLAVGGIVAWRDAKTRMRNRQGDTISPRHRFAYREFEGRSSARMMRDGATVVRRDASGEAGVDAPVARIDPERRRDAEGAA
jgi:hypothetical protein